MTVNEIRQHFFDFFSQKHHQIVPSAPIVIKEDPTLMFTNAGMNQFKDIFMGNRIAEFTKVANTQKCLRVSGKHNDLEEVGVDHYHHTMFEMLGNWSFGDYFKQEAIEWSWEFLTKVLHIDGSLLYVTVFEGNKEENIPFDQESFDIWKKFVPESRILKGNKRDNFWEMGDTGPCGPCTEIHYDARAADLREKIEGASLVNKDHPEVIEIWNNVFIQFNRTSDGKLTNLPEKHVDTGMGLERLTRVLQHKNSNYDTDIFVPIIEKVSAISGLKYLGTAGKSDIAFRVIADHIRAISFTIADGQLPSNTGAGYVIRRILRRAIRFGYSFLDIKTPFLYQLVPVLAKQFSGVFDELSAQQSFVAKVIEEEEKSFLSTLANGLELLGQHIKTSNTNVVDGKMVFELYDTFGFPKDLTMLIAQDADFTVDQMGFENLLAAQKDRSRADAKKLLGDWVEINKGISTFIGYDAIENRDAIILKYRSIEQKGEKLYHLVLDKTPFYGESGGQIGDTGILELKNGEQIEIIDTQKEQTLHLHIARRLPNDFQQTMIAKVDAQRRKNICAHHSATHLMHAALRNVLGNHVEQKGSLVHDEYLRFDFAHFAKLTEEELSSTENILNKKIAQSILLIEQREMPITEARKMGAMALFGEKYADMVRVITFEKGFSAELCGGTHVANTSEIVYFKIMSEAATSAGVRRIEAKAGQALIAYFIHQQALLNEINGKLQFPQNAILAIDKKDEIIKELQEKVGKFEKLQAKIIKQNLINGIEKINDYNLILLNAGEISAEELKHILFELKNTIPNLVGVIGNINQEKPMLTAFCADTMVERVNCSLLIKNISTHIQGGGGGQPFYATAGGKYALGIDSALKAAAEFLKNILN